ncbi:MAG: UDP-N-acetylmuramate:L-alanyl-gamma-D-glutamyl-meso-diaminopimelate ligase [Proteobacteria bacterium]|nr:UDP-N-acetylmuramate:L-alanyl-gamma-D-glutamyl-meso-diaminopimelate ligase [Pseudomonadota bacterium]
MSGLSKNIIPDNVKKIHLIAVCGTGMGALACMLKDMDYEVTGSDQRVYPPMSDFLVRKGIFLMEGFGADNLSHRPDLVIVGNAVRKDNPEVVRMIETGLFYCSMPQALNRFAAKGKKTLLVTGTHGKTTTSSILAWILYKAGLDPSFMIGGIVKNFDSNYRIGNGDYFVVEGDEYDTAFFDKGPKFLHFNSSITVLTSIEFDHADIFRDLEHVKQTFGNMIGKIPPANLLIVCDGDENIDSLIKNRDCVTERYGRKEDSSWKLGSVYVKPPWTFFDVIKKGYIFGTFKTKLVGEHNLLNALSVIAVADHLSVPASAISEALETFEGAKRRQEVRGVKKGITVMDDFAHHPTAVRETIKAVKPFYSSGRIIAVFEPRTNSSMRKVFQDIYPVSFDVADIVCISRPPLLDKIPPGERFSSKQLVEDLKRRGKDAHYFDDTQSIINFLVKESKAGDLLLIMSNGGFENIHERLLKAL